jgi:hypothetical protein
MTRSSITLAEAITGHGGGFSIVHNHRHGGAGAAAAMNTRRIKS